MVFSSNIFYYLFLPATLLVYFIFKPALRNLVLLAASFVFYYYGEENKIWILAASIAVNYVLALWMANDAWALKDPPTLIKDGERTRFQKRVLSLAVAANLVFLCYFKYINFAIINIDRLFSVLGLPTELEPIVNYSLPLGISFFTFQCLSYIIDVYRGEVRANRNLATVGTYVAMFPQLIAGPIVRYAEIEKEINTRRRYSLDQFFEGLYRFSIGFAKKILIANPVAACVDGIFAIPANELSMALAWIGLVAFTIQLYFDFSGYSDMAIGLGRIFGFRFPENFNYPYLSKSITDFWTRWHLTLTRWFRDYLYIPLGGNRRGTARMYLNLMIVFLLCGLWHGAEWNFVIFGAYHGLCMVIERGAFGRFLGRLPTLLQRLYFFAALHFGWIIFRPVTIGDSWSYGQVAFGLSATSGNLHLVGDYLTNVTIICMLLGMLFSMPLLKKLEARLAGSAVSLTLLKTGLVVFFLLSSLTELSVSSYNPFIYFRF